MSTGESFYFDKCVNDTDDATRHQHITLHKDLAILVHSCMCNGTNCPDQECCQKMRELMSHATTCLKYTREGCIECNKAGCLFLEHSKICKEMVCHVPMCTQIRKMLQMEQQLQYQLQYQLQQQQMQQRIDLHKQQIQLLLKEHEKMLQYILQQHMQHSHIQEKIKQMISIQQQQAKIQQLYQQQIQQLQQQLQQLQKKLQ